MLGFARPFGLLALVALAVLVWLRLRERRQRALDVPSLLLWATVRDDRERRRFQIDLSFLLQAAALAAIALALGLPYGSGGADESPARRVVFVFDTSASMQTMEPAGITRFEQARKAARAVLGSLGADDESMVIAVDTQPRVALPLTRDHTAVAAAIEGLEPREGLSRLAFGVQLARSARVADVALEIAVFSDLPRDALRLPLGPGEKLRYFRFGRSDDNVAIASLRVDRNPFEEAGTSRAWALVRNYSDRQREAELHVELSGKRVQDDKVVLGPGESRVVPIRALAETGRLVAWIDVGDALAADNRAYAYVAPFRPIRILAVTARPGFDDDLKALARAAPAFALRVVSPTVVKPADFAAADVAILHDWAPSEPLATNALFVHPPQGAPLFAVDRDVVGARILDWDDRHPLLQDLRYVEALALGPARRVRVPEWGRAVLTSRADQEEFALAFAGETNGRRIVCFAFDLAETSLRRSDHLSLVLFVLNALRWLSPPDPTWPLAIDVGETFREVLPAAAEATIVSPDGRRETTAALARIDLSIDEVGEHQVTVGGVTRTVLGNLFDPEESNVGRADEVGEFVTAGAPVAGVVTAIVDTARDYARPLLLLALALVLVEWGHALRRETGDA